MIEAAKAMGSAVPASEMRLRVKEAIRIRRLHLGGSGMGILKCTHTISVTALLATAWSFPPPPSLRMRYSGTLAARMSVLSIADPGRGFAQALAQGHASG